MEWRKEWEKEYKEKGDKDEIWCWREWGGNASSIWTFIQVMVDLQVKETGHTREWEKEPEAVVFIAHTPGGELKKIPLKNYDELAETLGTRCVKFVERGGTSLQAIICQSNPWEKSHCRRVCHMCDNGDLGSCRAESVCYEIRCAVCEKEGQRRVYIGETGKSGWERASQHWREWRGKKEGNALHKHDMNDHEGKLLKTDMKMRILSKPRKALQRQVEEAIRILEEDPESLLNSKSGFGNNKIPRISVMMGDEDKSKRGDRETRRE